VAGMAIVAVLVTVAGYGYRMLAPEQGEPEVLAAEVIAAESGNVSAEAEQDVPVINPDTDEMGNTVVPIPWIEEKHPGATCAELTVHAYFEFDKTGPDIASIVVLEEALARGFDCDLREVRIEAHDDLYNSPAYAQALSERRAREIASLLVAKGVDASLISTIGYGSSQPVEAGKRSPVNRRASIFLNYQWPASRLAAPPPERPG
jgi:outer membrane protein OmpA-like peptidoglycan-associated protein